MRPVKRSRKWGHGVAVGASSREWVAFTSRLWERTGESKDPALGRPMHGLGHDLSEPPFPYLLKENQNRCVLGLGVLHCKRAISPPITSRHLLQRQWPQRELKQTARLGRKHHLPQGNTETHGVDRLSLRAGPGS